MLNTDSERALKVGESKENKIDASREAEIIPNQVVQTSNKNCFLFLLLFLSFTKLSLYIHIHLAY